MTPPTSGPDARLADYCHSQALNTLELTPSTSRVGEKTCFVPTNATPKALSQADMLFSNSAALINGSLDRLLGLPRPDLLAEGDRVIIF